ncbi:MAG: hypothetical protein AAF989_09095 [Planctomycetota bacterium]
MPELGVAWIGKRQGEKNRSPLPALSDSDRALLKTSNLRGDLRKMSHLTLEANSVSGTAFTGWTKEFGAAKANPLKHWPRAGIHLRLR